MSELPGVARVDLGQVLGLLMLAATVGGGQLPFRFGAGRLVLGNGLPARAASFASAPMFAAIALFGAATMLWVYPLHGLPLSLAYPFSALAFEFVALLSWIALQDALDVRYVIDLVLMLAGLYLVSSGR